MSKIAWCLEQKKGIELVEPNDNLSQAYQREAINTVQLLEGKDTKWEVIMAYYACYHALYAILLKCGLKCEIHDCTLEMMKYISLFTEKDYNFISNLKDKRVRCQYYLKEERLEDIRAIKNFVLLCQNIAEKIDADDLRSKIKSEKN